MLLTNQSKLVTFENKVIENILQSLNPHKTHGHDMISIQMLKICGVSICKLLGIVHKARIEKGKFPSEWKKANTVPVHKSGDKELFNITSTYLREILEHLLYNTILKFFIENDLISLTSWASKHVIPVPTNFYL